MSQVIKTYMILFLIFLGIFTFTGYIRADMNAARARDFHGDVISEIENSSFSKTVIAECKKVAKEAGYQLTVSPVTNSDNEILMAEVVLVYTYAIPYLGISGSLHEIRGFAR